MTGFEQDTTDLGLLDILVVLAESWRLIFSVTALVTALVYCVVSLQPRQYEAQASLALYPMDLRDIDSTKVLNSAIHKLVPGASSELTSRLRAEFTNRLHVSGRNPGHLQDPVWADRLWTYDDAQSEISFTDVSPRAASNRLIAILTAFSSGPGQERLAALRRPIEFEIQSLETSLALQTEAAESIQKRLASDRTPDVSPQFASVVTALSARSLQINDRLTALKQTLVRLPTTLDPTLSGPARPVEPHRGILFAIATAIFVLALLVAFTLARSGLRTASQAPGSSAKISRIKAAMPFGGGGHDAAS